MGNALNWFTKPTTCRRWTLYFFTFAVLSTLIFAVPVLADLGKSAQAMSPRSGMLIPLYIYPTKGAWDPLYDAIQSHPSVDFIIVINPASGPGVTPLPDENYTREITRLNSFPNVRTIGYVAVQYGRKVIQTAFEEVTQYAAWSEQNKDLAMQGIFLDESPQIADEHNSTFLDQLQQHIKNQKELSGGLLVMNPGMIPDSRILSTADKTVVFEEQYHTYINRQAAKSLAALPDRDALICLMHSIPEDMPAVQLKALVSELRELAGSMFLTDFSDLYYERFSPKFSQFIDAMA